jgi:integrase/recombinase XerD
MKTHNPDNERIKRAYFTYLVEAQGFSEATLDGIAKAINRFETYTKFRDFKAFHIEQVKGFKASLAEQMSLRTKDRLSKATLYSTLNALKRFFIWLAGQQGYKSRISYSDAEYFNLSTKETRVAKARREERVPTLEQIRHLIRTMPANTELERRDRALVAFTILTGARDRATASIKLKHVDLDQGRIIQDARQVNTKFSKTFTTWFFPVGDDILQMVIDWGNYLRQEKVWGGDDPLFPATKIVVGASRHFEVSGLDRKHWSSAGPIRKIFKDAFVGAGLPYFNPHSFRKMLAQLGEKLCRTPEQFKAWSQNLGHEKVLTTFSSYGEVAAERQRDIIRELGQPIDPDRHVQEILSQLMQAAKRTAA